MTLLNYDLKLKKICEVEIKNHQIITFILAVSLILAGCSSYQTAEAEQLLQKARSHYQKALDRMNSFSKKTRASSSNLLDFQKNLKKAMVDLDKAQKELDVAAKSIERIKDLKVEEWRVKHAEILIKSIEAEKEAVKYARSFAEGLQVVMKSVSLLEASTKEIKAGSTAIEQASTALTRKKWSEAESKLRQAKNQFERALIKARQLKTSGLEGINQYEKFILTLIKLNNQFDQFNQAMKNSQTSRAKKILDQIEATSNELKKTNLNNLSADEVIDILYQQFTETLDRLEAEAEGFRNLADKLYRENIR